MTMCIGWKIIIAATLVSINVIVSIIPLASGDLPIKSQLKLLSPELYQSRVHFFNGVRGCLIADFAADTACSCLSLSSSSSSVSFTAVYRALHYSASRDKNQII